MARHIFTRLTGAAFTLSLAASAGRNPDQRHINVAREVLADPASPTHPAERAALAAALASAGPALVSAGPVTGAVGGAPVVRVPDVAPPVMSPAVQAAIAKAGKPAAPKVQPAAPMSAADFGRANWQRLGAASPEAGAQKATDLAVEGQRIAECRQAARSLKARGRANHAAKRGDPRVEECRQAARAVRKTGRA